MVWSGFSSVAAALSVSGGSGMTGRCCPRCASSRVGFDPQYLVVDAVCDGYEAATFDLCGFDGGKHARKTLNGACFEIHSCQ